MPLYKVAVDFYLRQVVYVDADDEGKAQEMANELADPGQAHTGDVEYTVEEVARD